MNEKKKNIKLTVRKTSLQNLSAQLLSVLFYIFIYLFYFCNYRTCLLLSDLLIFDKFVVFHKHSIVEDIQRALVFVHSSHLALKKKINFEANIVADIENAIKKRAKQK